MLSLPHQLQVQVIKKSEKKLFSISQVTFKPIQDNTTKSVMCHFIQKNIMFDGIKRLGEI